MSNQRRSDRPTAAEWVQVTTDQLPSRTKLPADARHRTTKRKRSEDDPSDDSTPETPSKLKKPANILAILIIVAAVVTGTVTILIHPFTDVAEPNSAIHAPPAGRPLAAAETSRRCDVYMRERLARSPYARTSTHKANGVVADIQAEWPSECSPAVWNPLVTEVAKISDGQFNVRFFTFAGEIRGHLVTMPADGESRWVYPVQQNEWNSQNIQVTRSLTQTPRHSPPTSMPRPTPTITQPTRTVALTSQAVSSTTPPRLHATATPKPTLHHSGQKYPGGSPLNNSEIERLIIAYTNEERKKAGLRSFIHDSMVSNIARGHSQNMAQTSQFSHQIDGKDQTARALAAGYDCRAYRNDGSYSYGLSENIAFRHRVTETIRSGQGPQQVSKYDSDQGIAQGLVQQWMNSPGHKKNILATGSNRIGVGVFVAVSEKHGIAWETIWATQNFSPCK